MIEDDMYRASTQYKHWSFTPQELANRRKQANELASEKVRDAFRRARKGRNGKAEDDDQDREEARKVDVQVETLTVDEELKIVEWGCGKIIEMGEAMRPRVPGGVVVRPFHLLVPYPSSTHSRPRKHSCPIPLHYPPLH